MNRLIRTAAAVLTAALVATLAPAARAADPYEINVILPLTGNIAFVGTTQLQALKAVEAYVNKTGGIGGRPLSFVVADDGSDVKTALQLAQGLIAKNVPVIMGSSSPQACAAIAPLVAANGPLHYCLANAGTTVPGSYEFFTQFTNDAQLAVLVRYFRERGMKKIASIFSIDGGGQDAEHALTAALALPENKDVQLVAHEHFAPGDISVAAQMTRIKEAAPNVLIAWATGGPAGTLLRNERDAGMDIPTVTSTGNLSANFFKQFGAILPTNLYFAAVPYYSGDSLSSGPTKAAVATMTSSLAAIGSKPDMIEISGWDPAMLVVDALRKLGPDASAAKLRAYLLNVRGWVGVNGPYDFHANPQRGVGEANVVIVRWDPAANTATAVSKPGGALLASK
jgi:branched-chain amino acid transport system substrate-binding protein